MKVYHSFKVSPLESDVIRRIINDDVELTYSAELDTVDYKVLCDCIEKLDGIVFLQATIQMGENPPILCLPTNKDYGLLFYYQSPNYQSPKKNFILIAGGIGGGEEGGFKTYWRNEVIVTWFDLPHYLY